MDRDGERIVGRDDTNDRSDHDDRDVNRAFRKGKVAPVIVSGSACGYGISRLR